MLVRAENIGQPARFPMGNYPPCFVCYGPSEFEENGEPTCRYCLDAFDELREASHKEYFAGGAHD